MFPEHNIPLQNVALGSEFGAVSELGPRWVPPWLAMGGLQGPVETRPFHAKSAFTAKENTVAVLFSCRHHQASSRAHGARGSPDPLGPKGILGLGEN